MVGAGGVARVLQQNISSTQVGPIEPRAAGSLSNKTAENPQGIAHISLTQQIIAEAQGLGGGNLSPLAGLIQFQITATGSRQVTLVCGRGDKLRGTGSVACRNSAG